MRRIAQLVAVALAGVVLGALTVVAVQAPAVPEEPAASEVPVVAAAPLPAPAERILLVWGSGGVPTDLADTLAALPGITSTTVVAGDRVDLVESRNSDGAVVGSWADGSVVPLDALAVDPVGYAALLPPTSAATFAGLRGGEAVLGETSARLRGTGAGGILVTSSGVELRIGAVVDDQDVAGAEVVVARATASDVGIVTDRFVLLTYKGERAAVESAIRGAAPDLTLRVRAPGETPFLRHGDAVLPQVLVKERFGEFSFRPPPGDEREFEPDPAFEAANIVSEEVPLLGVVRCHRGIVDALRGALEDLVARGLAHLVDPTAFAGCHNPRLTTPGGSVSHHAWGVAFDLNYDANPTGIASVQDPRLVETLERWGFTWGGFWLVPDPAHFEYRGPPDLVMVKARAAD
ncbi:MAG: M15 family metallopeptidase [Actinobacteria bacterium]|nr:M15 family metallopeptidase [Actinomycetota bacterium]